MAKLMSRPRLVQVLALVLALSGLSAVTVSSTAVSAAAASEVGPAHRTVSPEDSGETHSLFVPVRPVRLLDTRTGGGRILARGTRTVQAAGNGGLPSSGVAAVVVNLTVTDPVAPGFLTAYPTGASRPGVSSVNYDEAQTVANQAVVKVDGSGSFTLYGSAATHAVVDVTGYFPTGATYAPLSPVRVLDTRTGTGAPEGMVRAGGVVRLRVAGVGGVPISGAGAVVLNVTDAAATGAGFVTVYPAGTVRPDTSTLNYARTRSAAGMTIAEIGDDGYVDLYSSAASHLVADVAGWFPATPDYTPLSPSRALDTRTGTGRGGFAGPLKAGKALDLQLAGAGGVPGPYSATPPSAVEVTVTVTNPRTAGFITTYQTGVPQPGVSTLSYARGQTIANSATIAPGDYGRIRLASSADTDVVVDVVGYFHNPAADPAGGRTSRVSVASDTTQGAGDSFDSAISADGRFITYSSDASNLVRGDTNGVADVFLYERATGRTTRVSVASDGTQADDTQSDGSSGSHDPAISRDGRFITYSSEASNLVPGDTNDIADVFVYDRTTGQTARISTAADGTQTGGGSRGSRKPSVDGDGRYIAYESDASNIVAGDTNNFADVFVYDRATGQTARTSVASDGTQANLGAGDPAISGDGGYVTYSSYASNLVPTDTNKAGDVFVSDRTTGQTALVSSSTSGAPGDTDSLDPAISGDGRYITYSSDASTLVPSDRNFSRDVFSYDRATGETTRISVATDGTEAGNASFEPAISGDGRYITYGSWAGNLVPSDFNGTDTDVFLYDRTTRHTARVSVADNRDQGDDDSDNPAISGDGRYITYESDASTLIPGDTNHATDVFLLDRRGG